MENMILAQGNELRFIHSGCSGSGVEVEGVEKSKHFNQVPKVRRGDRFVGW